MRVEITVAALAVVAGCAQTVALGSSEAPPALRPPEGQVLFLEVPARGDQIYECAAGKDQPPRFEWTFKAPEAELLDRSGRTIGKHYAGPTWEASDGSAVVGKVEARHDAPDASAIPWLLLSAQPSRGEGSFSKVRSIQRLHTRGGKAPAEPCTAERAGQLFRVPYQAAYYFYAARP